MKYDPYKLISYLRESGLRLTQTSSSWVTDCPRCHKPNKLYFYKSTGRFVCWVCENTGFYGSAEYALSECLGKDPASIRVALLGRDFDSEIELIDPQSEEEIEFTEEIYVWPHNFYPINHQFSEKGLKYLSGRGIDRSLSIKYNIRYCPQNRTVVFPIEESGKLLGWQERITYPDFYVNSSGKKIHIPKTKTASGCKKANLLMFCDNLKGSEHAILTEGPIDAIKADLCGGNVCSMGKKVSRMQFEILLNHGIKKLYLGLDPDAAEDVQKMVHDWYGQFELYDMIPKRGDLGDMSPKEVLELYKSAPKIGAGSLFIYI